MKLYTILLASYVTLASGVKLRARKDGCFKDNCWRAVWGSTAVESIVRAVTDCERHQETTVITTTYSIATITILAHTTETAVASCSTAPISSSTSNLSSNASSLPGFAWPTPAPTRAGLLGKLKVRQAGIFSYDTTTVIGPIPTYAAVGCEDSDDIYSSACACNSLTSRSINSNGPMITMTSTATVISTSTVTSTASCSSSAVITLPHGSSTSVTTVAFTSSAGTGTGTCTGTGTVPPSSTASSSTTGFNTAMTPSSTVSSTSTTLNTTLSSSMTPTPSCITPGYILCNSTCLDPASDERNCGSCGNRCGDGLVCFNGVCARRPLDSPCDTNCTYRHECNTGISDASCSCARDSDGYGICFDANKYQCLNSTAKCKATTDCKLGGICIKSICAEAPESCRNTTDLEADGICVTNAGCGAQRPVNFGALLRFEEPQQRKRMAGGFNW